MNPKKFYEHVLSVIGKKTLDEKDKEDLFGNIFDPFASLVGSRILGDFLAQGEQGLEKVNVESLAENLLEGIEENLGCIEKGFKDLQEWKLFQESFRKGCKKWRKS